MSAPTDLLKSKVNSSFFKQVSNYVFPFSIKSFYKLYIQKLIAPKIYQSFMEEPSLWVTEYFTLGSYLLNIPKPTKWVWKDGKEKSNAFTFWARGKKRKIGSFQIFVWKKDVSVMFRFFLENKDSRKSKKIKKWRLFVSSRYCSFPLSPKKNFSVGHPWLLISITNVHFSLLKVCYFFCF